MSLPPALFTLPDTPHHAAFLPLLTLTTPTFKLRFSIEDQKQKILNFALLGCGLWVQWAPVQLLVIPPHLQQGRGCGASAVSQPKGTKVFCFYQDDLICMARLKEWSLFHSSQFILHLSHLLSLMTETGSKRGV